MIPASLLRLFLTNISVAYSFTKSYIEIYFILCLVISWLFQNNSFEFNRLNLLHCPDLLQRRTTFRAFSFCRFFDHSEIIFHFTRSCPLTNIRGRGGMKILSSYLPRLFPSPPPSSSFPKGLVTSIFRLLFFSNFKCEITREGADIPLWNRSSQLCDRAPLRSSTSPLPEPFFPLGMKFEDSGSMSFEPYLNEMNSLTPLPLHSVSERGGGLICVAETFCMTLALLKPSLQSWMCFAKSFGETLLT